ncbi:MAG: cellulase family glycosylhydrolase [Polyangiales bacterium]
MDSGPASSRLAGGAVLRVLAALLVAWAAASTARAEDFVEVRNGELVVGDAPFRFLGANVSIMHGPRERAAVGPVLDAVAADGLRVVRLWALGEASADAPDYVRDYAFRRGEEGWLEDSFVHLDRVLVEARARGLRVVVVLSNRWRDYGGFDAYARWSEPGLGRDRGGHVRSTELGVLYRSERFTELYREHVRRVVTRVSSLTGEAYADDPTILAWELANEVSAATAHDADALVAWVDAQARYVKSLDPHHLVSAGHIGYDTERERAVWARVASLPSVDYADAHAYPLGDARVTTERLLRAWLDDRIALAHGVVHKPLVVGEFGFDGSRAELHGRTRERWMRVFLDAIERRGVAGALVWIYEPATNPVRRHTVHAGDGEGAAGGVARRLLREAAAHVRRVRPDPVVPNPALERPLFRARRTLVGPGVRAHAWRREGGTRTLAIDVFGFHRARFELAGLYRGEAGDQLYGAGAGELSYLFAAPPSRGPPRTLRIRLRASSELDGEGIGADASETSRLELRIDGRSLGTVLAPVDDGHGHLVELVVDDRALLARLFGGGLRTHRLSIVTRSDEGAGGVCLYGAREGEADPGAGTLELVFEP